MKVSLFHAKMYYALLKTNQLLLFCSLQF